VQGFARTRTDRSYGTAQLAARVHRSRIDVGVTPVVERDPIGCEQGADPVPAAASRVDDES
jgi:hypothetical protein